MFGSYCSNLNVNNYVFITILEEMNSTKRNTAVPVRSTDLNQGLTAASTRRMCGRDAVTQLILHTSPSNNIPKKNLFIATYNVRTLSTEEHLTNLLEEIENVSWHVVGLCVVRRTGEQLMNLKEGHLLFHRGKENIKQSGVGFLVNKDLAKNVKRFQGESDRVASPNIKTFQTL